MIIHINRFPKIIPFFASWGEHILIIVADFFSTVVWKLILMMLYGNLYLSYFKIAFYSKNGKCCHLWSHMCLWQIP